MARSTRPAQRPAQSSTPISPLVWRNARLLGLAATDASAANGTSQMAAEVGRLASDTTLVGYGQDTDSAGELLLTMLRDAGRIETPHADRNPGDG